MHSEFRILAIGDVVGPSGVDHLAKKLWAFRNSQNINMVVCNAENAAIGNGLDPQSASRLLKSGCDILTGGNHIFRKKELRAYLNDSECLIRPANYPNGTAGYGYSIVDIDGFKVLVINVLGVIYLDALSCPFETVDRILDRENGNYDFSVLDIHAEATSEKLALGHYFDGRISCIFGTHTHVATADAQILPHGSGYITDLGMTGPHDGVLGVRTEIIIEKMRTKMPVKFELSDGVPTADGAIFTLNFGGKCTSVESVSF